MIIARKHLGKRSYKLHAFKQSCMHLGRSSPLCSLTLSPDHKDRLGDDSRLGYSIAKVRGLWQESLSYRVRINFLHDWGRAAATTRHAPPQSAYRRGDPLRSPCSLSQVASLCYILLGIFDVSPPVVNPRIKQVFRKVGDSGLNTCYPTGLRHPWLGQSSPTRHGPPTMTMAHEMQGLTTPSHRNPVLL